MSGADEGRRTLFGEAGGEIVEKKSRFIAALAHVESEAEAEAFLAAQKKKYYDARHHCSAYIVSPARPDGGAAGETSIKEGTPGHLPDILRSNDDGEPGGSAGRPMLSVLEGEGLHDVIAVVTRYFGGTLLGVGGLIRAYQGAVKEALKNASFLERRTGRKVTITASYNDDGKLKYQFRQEGLTILDTVYDQDVTTTLLLPEGEAARVIKAVTDLTGARALIEEGPTVGYDWADGEVLAIYEKETC